MSLVRRVVSFPLTRLVLILLAAGAFALPVVVALHLAKLGSASVVEGVMAVATLCGLWVVVRFVERRPFWDTFLPLTEAPRSLAGGFALGAALIALVVGALAVLGAYRVTGLGGSGAGLVATLLGALLFYLVVAVFEEALFRGVVFRLFEEMLGTWAALAVSALLFGLAHWSAPHASLFSSVAIAVEAGILLGAIYVQRRTLWLPIGVHWAWNFAEGPVFGSKVSGTAHGATLLVSETTGAAILTGGEFGPEAGLVAVVTCTAAGVFFCVRAAREKLTVAPMWKR